MSVPNHKHAAPISEEIPESLPDLLTNFDSTFIAIVLAIIIGLITIALLVCRRRANKRRGVLMIGLCDSGKTLLFNRLVDKRYVDTYTSIKENQGQYTVKGDKKGTTLTLLDLPGHERLRVQVLDKYKHMVRGIIFVVDSLTLQKELKDVAGFLYAVLTDSVIATIAPPVVIACNKSELMLAKGAKVIQDQLEKEITTLRLTQSAALQSTDSNEKARVFIGKRGEDFRFAHLRSIKVSFVECSAVGESTDHQPQIEQLEAWLSNIA